MIPVIKALENPKQRRALHELKARLEKNERRCVEADRAIAARDKARKDALKAVQK